MRGARIVFPKVSVGATHNVLLAAALAKGETVIENAAREPEIGDVALASAKWAPRSRASALGAAHPRPRPLEGTFHTVLPDRIETGTFAMAVAATGGDVTLEGARLADLKRRSTRCVNRHDRRRNQIRHPGRAQWRRHRPRFSRNAAVPGLPDRPAGATDGASHASRGTSVIRETIFENRFMHVQELARLGADIQLQGDTATIRASRLSRARRSWRRIFEPRSRSSSRGWRARARRDQPRLPSRSGLRAARQKLSRCGADIERLSSG